MKKLHFHSSNNEKYCLDISYYLKKSAALCCRFLRIFVASNECCLLLPFFIRSGKKVERK